MEASIHLYELANISFLNGPLGNFSDVLRTSTNSEWMELHYFHFHGKPHIEYIKHFQ